MSNLYGVRKPNTNLRKNVFDLSEKTLYSQSAGMLLPTFCREVNPGEKVQISMSAMTRTQPLNTAAFVRNRQYFHFFFVPFKQLWSGWDNFINGVDYKTSALQKGKNYRNVPMFPFYKYVYQLYNNKVFGRNADAYTKKDAFGYEYLHGMSRLLDMLGYGLNFDLGNQYKKELQINNFGYSQMSSLSDIIRLIDQFYDPSKVGVLAPRLGDPNALSHLVSNSFDSWKNSSVKFNIFRILAYQKIYSDFYKRDDYEATDPESFNIDDFSSDNPMDINALGFERFIKMFQLRYRWSPKDYFTGVVPSELFNTPNNVASIGTPRGAVSDEDGFISVTSDKNSVAIENSMSLSTKAIRASFAIEKLLRLTRRAAGQDYISQTAAHYGFEPPKGRGDKVDFIGGFANDINISEVVTTANTDQGSAGMIYGKGVGGMDLGKDFEYTAKEHGIIMCISSVVPELDYSAEGLNSFNAKFHRGDYFQPEFQDLGLQPVFGYELINRIGSNFNNAVIGYAPRYAEYKTAYDTLHGEFRNGRTMSAWSANTTLEHDSSGIKIATLRINPKSLDRIFSLEFDGSEKTDQFQVNAQFVCKIIRPMSITGQQL